MDDFTDAEIDWRPCAAIDEKYRPVPGQRSGKHHRRVQRALTDGYIAGWEAGYTAGKAGQPKGDRE